ncbi:response regulator [Kitasatospora sp. NPDC094011]|uniref:response regulator n=1 Tax=Kitasatospora sp. NPDC094011 TaxID=3364090 RepID=UPI0037F93CE0
MIRLLIADDEPLVRFGLRTLLDAVDDIHVVGEAADGAQAVARTRELVPDVVITDLRMPGMDGLAATRRLREMPNPPAILVLTTFDTSEGVTDSLTAGADGYLLKDAPPERILHAIRMVASGGIALAPTAASHLVKATPRRTDPAVKLPLELRRALAHLTDRQREVLTLVGQGLSNADIARRMHLTEGTVRSYVSRLLATLGLTNRTQAAILAHRAGLLDEQRTAGR